MIAKKCKFCKIEFYPYMKQRVYCSLKCYKKQKNADDITKWKIKRETRAIEGKPCKRCSKSFTAKYNNSQYCDECRDTLNSNKKGKQVIKKKKKILYCTSCACELDDVVAKVKNQPRYEESVNVIMEKWDKASKDAFYKNPQILELLNIDMQVDPETGFSMYDKVIPIAEKMKALETGASKTDLEYYQMAGAKVINSMRKSFESQQEAEKSKKKSTKKKSKEKIDSKWLTRGTIK